SCGDTSCKAEAIASVTVFVVRAATDRNDSLTLENISSMGVRSGLHGGSGTTLAPAASTALTTTLALCGLRLSQITTSPACRCGTRTCSTSLWKAAVSVAP